MLSSSANGIYWMARYMERAGFMSRLLHLQAESLVDRPITEIHFGWRRIYAAIDRHPLGGIHGLSPVEDHDLVDAYLLTDELTFERSNPESVLSCIGRGRENARQVRHRISEQMWTSLNTEYLRVNEIKLTDIWLASPAMFYSELLAGIDRFNGVATATMYRDEGWHFYRIGQFVERIQFTCSLLLTQLQLEAEMGELAEASWRSLLRIFHASGAYDHTHSIEIEPDLTLDLLVSDRQLPESLLRSVNRAGQELSSLPDGPNRDATEASRRLGGRLGALLRYDWPDRDDREAVLRQVLKHARHLHTFLSDTYFDYTIQEVRGAA
jgi:uncharacterized alpha-E superfamily protein